MLARCLGAAAALAAGQVSLSLTGDGTYLATVEMESIPVKLLVDAYMGDLWVKCAAIEGPSCADGITTRTSGYSKTYLDRLERNVPTKTKRFVSVTIGGQVFNGFDAFVVYDSMAELDPSIQGILGLNYKTEKIYTPSMYLDDQVSTVALQLGSDETSSMLSLNSIDTTRLRTKTAETRVTLSTDGYYKWLVKATCLWVPLAGGNVSTPECTTTGSSTYFDPAATTIGISSTTLDLIERRFLYACTAIKKSYSILYYTCDTTVKLPRLMLDFSEWRFYLDPIDYTEPIRDNSQVKVLLGEDGNIYSGWVLGTPFLRKYPVVFNRTAYTVNVYCQQNTTCMKLETESRHSNNYHTPVSGGGPSGGGGTSGGGYDSDLDVSTRRKNKKLYIAIGASVGGIAILCLIGCCCKACAKDDNEEDSKAIEAAECVQVSFEVGVGDSKDRSRTNDDGKGSTAPVPTRKPKLIGDGDSSSASSSSSYDTDSSEERERRKERRRRRQRRRERRKAKREARRKQNHINNGEGDTSHNSTNSHYIGLQSPRR